MLEVCFAVLLGETREGTIRIVLSVLISIAFVQAVHVAQGGNAVGCFGEVVDTCYKLPTDTIGGQLAVMAAVYARVLSPPIDVSDVRRRLALRHVGVLQQVPDVDENLLSSNMYWIGELGKDVNQKPTGTHNVAIGWGNALFSKTGLASFDGFP